MKTRHLLLTLTGLLIGFTLIVGGLFLFFAPSRLLVAQLSLPLTGILMMSLGALLLVCYALLSRRQYVLIEMGDVQVHEEIFKQAVSEKLHHLFPSQKIDCEVMIHKKGQIEILAKIPLALEDERFEEVEVNLATALAKCGYCRPFVLNVQVS